MPMRQGGAADGYHGWFADPVGCRSGSEYHSMRPERTRHDSRGPARADRGLPAGGDASAHCFEWAVPALVVVTDPAKRAALAGFYKQAWDAYLPLPFSAANLHFDDQVHEAQQPRVTSSAAYLADHMADVPALVIPCITPRVDGMPMWVQACIWGSVLPQTWSFMLAARARGLASAWTQIHIQFEEEFAAVLGINHAEVQQAALIAVAYPRREDFKPAYREPIQKFTHWDSW